MRRQRQKSVILMLITLPLVLILSGCWILSFHPLYFEDDLVFEKELLGSWASQEEGQDDAERWTFLRKEEPAYRLIVTDDEGGEGEFEARLLRLDRILYLDLLPLEPEKGNEFHFAHLVPCHSFLRVELEDGVLRLRAMDYDWLNDRLKDGRIKIGHARREDGFILTAPTGELQKFIRKHAKKVFSSEAGILKRVQEQPVPHPPL
jgi:hypothetical protein